MVPLTPELPCNLSEEVVEFREDPVKAKCKYCFAYEYTRVEQKINSEGWMWCILCFCCGIWLLSFLVKCMDGFREWTHYCQSCNRKIATYSPAFTPASRLFLILLALFALTVFGFAVYLRLLGPQKWNLMMNKQ